jgi:hypothetical protein
MSTAAAFTGEVIMGGTTKYQCVTCGGDCAKPNTQCWSCWTAGNGTPSERFWRYVDKREPDKCWPWVGAKKRDGYGVLTLRVNGVQRVVSAHRFAWELAHGPIPPGMFVCHRCDNSSCCTYESHLFIGTAADNSADMVAKGRGRGHPWYGEDNYGAKLTWLQVRELRDRHKNGESAKALSLFYGIHRATCYKIIAGKKWRE